MAFEAFNQVIKKMFNRSNYKSAARSVAEFWSMRSARALRHGKASAWYQDHACVASELSDEIAAMREGSEILSALCDELGQDEIVSARQLHSFSRGAVEVKVGQWVACEDAESGESYFVRVGDLMQIFTAESHCIYMLGEDCVQPASAQTAWMSISEHAFTGAGMLINTEEMIISQLHAVHDGDEYRFQYLW